MLRLFAASLTLCLACGPTATGGGDDDAGGGQPDAFILPDMDGDGYPSNVDCNDNDPNINPAVPENCDNGIDDNCNGQTDTDLECLTACEAAEVQQSYFGCEFYAVDLPQYNTDKIYAVIVANPSNSVTANATVSTEAGEIASFTVAPRGVYTWQVSPRPRNVPGAGTSTSAYKIVSDLPVAAYQFNSLDTVGAASTDATLLFARHSLAKLYYAMDYTSRVGDDSFISVVATEPDTSVTIAPAASVSGATSGTLQPFQVMTVLTTTANTSLTGSLITADKPVAVFGGNRCTNIPYGMSYCDHIEHQLFPRVAEGDRYIVGKLHARTRCNVADYIRVMSDDAGAVVTLDPPVAGPFTLNAGQWQEFTITQSVEISSTKPIIVGQFMRSSNAGECSDEGDPAFIMQVPVDQYRPDYVFLTPPTYDSDWVDIIAPPDASVSLDGVTLTLDSNLIGATGHTLTSTLVADGPHVVIANQPVSVIVYGYGGPSPEHSTTQNVSYAYAAGMNLAPINPVE